MWSGAAWEHYVSKLVTEVALKKRLLIVHMKRILLNPMIGKSPQTIPHSYNITKKHTVLSKAFYHTAHIMAHLTES